VRAGDPTPDSDRARRRIGALFHESVFAGHIEQLASYCAQGLGIPLPNTGSYPSHWHRFVRECHVGEFLDVVTMSYRYLFWHVSDGAANWWRDVVRKIFSEENLAYEIDSVGGVHPKIDREFQRNMGSAVAGFESERYQGVRDLLAAVEKNLNSIPPNYRQACRSSVSAVEVLFSVMFPYAVLTPEEIDRRLVPLLERAYDGDPVAQTAALSLVAEDGAKVRESLTARAVSLRRRELADLEGQAGEKSQSMLVAQMLLCAGFLIFLTYPVVGVLLSA